MNTLCQSIVLKATKIYPRAQCTQGRSISTKWTAASKHSELLEEDAKTNSKEEAEEEKTEDTNGHPIH